MRTRIVLPLLLLALPGALAACVPIRDPTLDEMDPGRHARDYTVPPTAETWGVFGPSDVYRPPPDPWP